MAPVTSIAPDGFDAPVTFAHLKDANKRLLFETLDRRNGPKAVVWDPDLIKAFGLVATNSELKEKGLAHNFTLQKGSAPQCTVEHVIFIVKPTIKHTEWVADNVNSLRSDDKRQFHLLFVPRTSVICEQKLQELGASDKLSSVEDLPVYFFDLDTDVASMESNLVLRNCLLHDDWSVLYDLVAALDQLESVYGRISRVCYKGDWSQHVYRMLQKKREQDALAAGSAGKKDSALSRVPLIDTVLLIDRWVDPITPLVTQLTYEGLIDEIFGLKCGSAKFPKDNFADSQQESRGGQSSQESDSKMKQLTLNSAEQLHSEVRDLNISAVGSLLSRRSKSIKEQIDVIRVFLMKKA